MTNTEYEFVSGMLQTSLFVIAALIGLAVLLLIVALLLNSEANKLTTPEDPEPAKLS